MINKKLLIYIAIISSFLFNFLIPKNSYACPPNNHFGVWSDLDQRRQSIFSQTDISFYDPFECIFGSSANIDSEIKVSGKDLKEKIWRGLTSFLSKEQAAGIMGNMQNESGFNPARLEDSFAGSNIDLENNSKVSCGIGLIQWSFGRRVNVLGHIRKRDSSLMKYFKDTKKYGGPGKDFLKLAGDQDTNKLITLELEYLKKELSSSYKSYLKCNSVNSCSDHFLRHVEIPADIEGQINNRRKNAQSYYDRFKNLSPNSNSSTIGNSSNNSKKAQSITFIGDSITEGVKNQLPSKINGLKAEDISSKVGRHWSEGITIAKKTNLKKIVVFALGTNDSLSSKEVEEAIKVFGDRKVIFVTNYTKKSDYANNNKLLKAAASQHKNITIADYAAEISKDTDKYIGGDGIHPNSKGQEVFINVIKAAINRQGDINCDKDNEKWPYYSQQDKKWSDYKKLGESGCGPSSFAMLASKITGKKILPTEVVDKSGKYYDTKKGSSFEITKVLAKQYGFQYKEVKRSNNVDNNVNIMKSMLKEGWYLHIHLRGPSPFAGSSGHVLGIYGLKSNGIPILADSGSRTGKPGESKYSLKDVATYLASAPIKGIKSGDGKSSSNCGDSEDCKNEDDGDTGPCTDDGFQTLEDAKKAIIDVANSPSTDFRKYNVQVGCAGGLKQNCSSFSTYFANRYYKMKGQATQRNGNKQAESIAAQGLKTGRKPKAFAVWSQNYSDCGIYTSGPPYGHTGVILGINRSKGEVFIGQAACNLFVAKASKVDLKCLEKSSKFTYVYPNGLKDSLADKCKGGGGKNGDN